ARAAAGADAPAAAPSNAGTTSDTGTNVQVAGVDEADVSKRSGDLLLTVAGKGDGLTVLRTSGGSAQVAGRLATTFHPDQLLVSGSTVLLLGTSPSGPIAQPETASPGRGAPDVLPIPIGTPRTRVAEVDVADPAHPRLVRTLELDGTSAGARLSGGLMQLALSAPPTRLPLVQPQPSATDPSDPTATQRAQTRNRAVVDGSTVDQWLPGYTLTPANGRSSSGSVVDCSRVGVPDRFSGLGTLTLLTFDLRTQGLARWDAAGVVASGTTLYATGDHAYVATTAWQQRVGPVRADETTGSAIVPGRTHTEIHEFATDAGRVRYLGSGEVAGTLLDQYSLDEYQGRLRVATTQGPRGDIVYPMSVPAPAPAATATVDGSTGSGSGSGSVGAPGAAPSSSGPVETVRPGPPPVPVVPRVTASSSAVTVLEVHDGTLRQVGRVDGLGRGETIKAVRFAGPVGYVVTFRQTDPLFALDLADPAHPRVTGELTMPGYSAYLHPLGGNLLLGIGRDASTDGITSGVLVSLFDVADPAHPRLLDRVPLPGTWAGVESDAHAFTYADGLALVPVESGVLAVPVRDRALGTPSVLRLTSGSAADGGVDAGRMRVFADADRLWTVAPAAGGALLAVHDVGDLSLQTSLRF
ncbi:MAG TPA: beta-propeller domain-containing protein, partial [Kineosporiaceae bacterium]|nr:beta-propeller domain-containing protein [Kineosporiaceae bacterium]